VARRAATRAGLVSWTKSPEDPWLQGLFEGTLDPRLVHTDHEYYSAAGCGGGFDEEKRGDETRGLRWYDRISEHAADHSSDGAWTPYGLQWPGTFSLGRHERGSGNYRFSASGPAPAVFELAWAWGRLVARGEVVTVEDARGALEEGRRGWPGRPGAV